MLRKFLVYGLSLIVFLFFASPTFAETSAKAEQTPTYAPLPAVVSPTSPIFTDLILHNTFHSFSCLAIGQSIIGQPCLSYQPVKNAQGAIQTVPVLSSVNLSGGALGATTSIIAALYMNPPVRTADYLASLGQGFGIVKQANAQVVGSGAGVLSPILSLWQVSRNISYLIMIIIFVIIGLMVMFRQRINPQTVITAQTALPGLVIGLILITFSYFLASLITDVSFLGVNVVGAYFSAAQPGSSPTLVQDIADKNVGTIFSKFVGMISAGDIKGVIDSILNSLDGGVQKWISGFAGLMGYQAGSAIGSQLGGGAGALLCVTAPAVVTAGVAAPAGFLISPFCAILFSVAGGPAVGLALAAVAAGAPATTFGFLLYFVAIAIMIYTMFKLLLKLINSYLNIIFLTISAPFQFLAASLPGRQGIATGWILNMLCHVLAFPAVFAVFYFVAYLMGPTSAPGQLFGITGQLSTTGNQTLPLLGGLSLDFIKIMLAYGALLATPAIPDIICRSIGRVSQAGQLLGQEISGGTRSGQGYAGQFQGRLGGTAGSIGKTLGGEMQYLNKDGVWTRYTGTPGMINLFRDKPPTTPSSGGSGRAIPKP